MSRLAPPKYLVRFRVKSDLVVGVNNFISPLDQITFSFAPSPITPTHPSQTTSTYLYRQSPATHNMPPRHTTALRLSELIPDQELRLPASCIVLGSQKKDEQVENALARVVQGRYPTKYDAAQLLIKLFDKAIERLPIRAFSRILYWHYVADDWLNVSNIVLDGDIVGDLILTIASDEMIEFMLEVQAARAQPNVFSRPTIQNIAWKNIALPHKIKKNKKNRANQTFTISQAHQYGGAHTHDNGADTNAGFDEREMEEMFADNSDTRELGNATYGDVEMADGYGDVIMPDAGVPMSNAQYEQPQGPKTEAQMQAEEDMAKLAKMVEWSVQVAPEEKAEVDARKKAKLQALEKAKAAKPVFTLTCRSRLPAGA
ncbi:hypothetical protein GE09DRAFT_1050099 [Coniochaeta sp. 2T2.1]|nr:hypothetical protein GE09DRAFT_1050099 [Coniochaeta sp. 2T2.1]